MCDELDFKTEPRNLRRIPCVLLMATGSSASDANPIATPAPSSDAKAVSRSCAAIAALPGARCRRFAHRSQAANSISSLGGQHLPASDRDSRES